MRVVHRAARTTKGWRKRAPHIPSDRRALKARCGAKAFLDPAHLKFPIMAKTGPCAVDCEGLRTAYARAKQFRHTKIATKAIGKATAAKCAWI